MAVYRLGIDIGGTFTDFSLLEEGTGHMRVLKTARIRPSLRRRYLKGFEAF